jgi:hypothetical protein
MFDELSVRGRRVLELAVTEAQGLRHDCIDAEHLLLAILAEGKGVAIKVLETLGVSAPVLRLEMDRLAQQGSTPTSGSELPFTPRSKRVLERAWAEAGQMGLKYVGTEHLLLGLVREPEGSMARLFAQHFVTAAKVRAEVCCLLGVDDTGGPEPAARIGAGRTGAAPYLDEARSRLRMVKGLADRALAQAPEAKWSEALGPEENSIAIVMKHMSGNMRSRWTDFLTTDGEKPDRNRDGEFEPAAADTPAALRARWEEGWALCFRALDGLGEQDLGRTVTIRNEPHTVLQAVNRQVSHYSYHVGQIVLLARHFAGPGWKSLSIPRGKSKEFEVSREGRVGPPERPR